MLHSWGGWHRHENKFQTNWVEEHFCQAVVDGRLRGRQGHTELLFEVQYAPWSEVRVTNLCANNTRQDSRRATEQRSLQQHKCISAELPSRISYIRRARMCICGKGITRRTLLARSQWRLTSCTPSALQSNVFYGQLVDAYSWAFNRAQLGSTRVVIALWQCYTDGNFRRTYTALLFRSAA
jgi:hypothetical protein